MRKIFSNIIITLTVFIATPGFAQTANCTDNGSGYSCSGSNMPSGGGSTGNLGAFMPPTNSGYGGSGTMSPEAYAAKQKAEAYGNCMRDLYNSDKQCNTLNNDNLLANQARCSNVAVASAGITLTVGVSLWISGVGAVPGALFTAAAGTVATLAYNQCNNIATNISNNGKLDCQTKFNQIQLKCDAIKP